MRLDRGGNAVKSDDRSDRVDDEQNRQDRGYAEAPTHGDLISSGNAAKGRQVISLRDGEARGRGRCHAFGPAPGW
jgi:hypothetical protein